MNDLVNKSDDAIADAYSSAHIDALASAIIAAYVSNNHITIEDLPKLINSVRATLAGQHSPAVAAEPEVEKLTPQQIKKSIAHDFLTSFEDGKQYKTLRRHLTLRGLTPDQYRTKWGLPVDYPMTSPGYSEQRSELARKLGLGQGNRAAIKDTAPSAAANAPRKKPAKSKVDNVAA